MRRLFAIFSAILTGLALGPLVFADPANDTQVLRLATTSPWVLADDFEGTGSELVWSESMAGGSTVNYDDTTTPPDGSSHCVALARGTGTCAISRTFTSQSDVYVFAWVRVTSLVTNDFPISVYAADGTTPLGALSIRTTGALRIYNGALSVSATTTGTISINTWYAVWAHWNLSTGAMDCEWQTSATKVGSGNNFTSTTGGTTGTNGAILFLGAAANSNTVRIDRVRVSGSAIGSNP